MDGVIVKWDGVFGLIRMGDGAEYTFKRSSEDETFKIGNVVDGWMLYEPSPL